MQLSELPVRNRNRNLEAQDSLTRSQSDSGISCVKLSQSEIREAGFFNVPSKFQLDFSSLPAHGFLQKSGAGCVWDVLIFVDEQCSGCGQVRASVENFFTEGFGDAGMLRFVEVGPYLQEGLLSHNALPSQHLFEKLGVGRLRVFDSLGSLSAQAAVVSPPVTLLLDPEGYVQGHFPGLLRFDQPGFEVLSIRVAEGLNKQYGSTLLQSVSLFFVVLFVILSYILARLR